MSRRFYPGLLTGDAELPLERTFREVGSPMWVKRIGVPPDVDMTPDVGFARIHQAQPNGSAVRGLLLRLARKRPSSIESGRRSCPAYAVHSQRSPALIFRHPFYGQGFAGKRVGQQPLQGLHLTPAAFPCCLYDTGLQPPDLTLTLGPVGRVIQSSPPTALTLAVAEMTAQSFPHPDV